MEVRGLGRGSKLSGVKPLEILWARWCPIFGLMTVPFIAREAGEEDQVWGKENTHSLTVLSLKCLCEDV